MAETPGGRDVAGAVGSVLLVALGAAAWWDAGDFSELGAVFPRTVGVLLVVLGTVYLALTLLGRTRRLPALGGSNARRLAAAAVLLGWAFGLPVMGFLASSGLAFALLLMIANHSRWTARTLMLYGASGLLVLGGLYALFKLALLVPLP